MSARWVRSGLDWIWNTWVADTQVMYLVRKTHPVWIAERKVGGAALPLLVGSGKDSDLVKAIAEVDAQQLQEKGF